MNKKEKGFVKRATRMVKGFAKSNDISLGADGDSKISKTLEECVEDGKSWNKEPMSFREYCDTFYKAFCQDCLIPPKYLGMEDRLTAEDILSLRMLRASGSSLRWNYVPGDIDRLIRFNLILQCCDLSHYKLSNKGRAFINEFDKATEAMTREEIKILQSVYSTPQILKREEHNPQAVADLIEKKMISLAQISGFWTIQITDKGRRAYLKTFVK